MVLYVNRQIKVNYAFKKGELKEADIEKILKDLPKITTVTRGRNETAMLSSRDVDRDGGAYGDSVHSRTMGGNRCFHPQMQRLGCDQEDS